MKRPAEEPEEAPSSKKTTVDLPKEADASDAEAPSNPPAAEVAEAPAAEKAPPPPAPFSSFLSSFTTDPASSPFQFPAPSTNGFSQLAQEAAKAATEEDDDQESGGFAPLSAELPAATANSVPKFDPVEVHTGEEGDVTLFTIKAKLLQLVPKVGDDSSVLEWKERGRGALKVNQNRQSSRCRLLLRTDGLHSLALNVNLDSSFSVVEPDAHATSLRFSCFTSSDKPSSYCIRFLEAKREDGCTYRNLYDKLKLAQDETKADGLGKLFGIAT
eukprot:GGOE01061513.1.p1 GENE.GGOE01061513.1~~GGOE01061513.1.p1  ORF type:complete len:272 (-),score=84.01 GGOE01061513.1:183-998(-)